MAELTNNRHELFALAYVAHGAQYGAAAAACKAIGETPENGKRLVDRPEIQARIRELISARHAELNITAQRVMQELASISFVKVSDLYDKDGDLIPPYMLPPHVAAAISGIDVEVQMQGRGQSAIPITIRKYRFWDKNPSLSVLAKHFKIVGNEEDGINALASALADRLKNARKRMYEQPQQTVEDAVIIEPAALPSPVPIQQGNSDEESLAF